MTNPARLAAPTTDPALLYRVRDAIYAVDLLTAGVVHFDVFTRLAAEPVTLEQLCASLGTQPRPTDVMVTLFCAMGLLEKSADRLHPTSLAREHLVEGSPWSRHAYYSTYRDRPGCLELVQVLRTGKPSGFAVVGPLESVAKQPENTAWARAMEDEGFAEKFTAAMDARGACLGPALAQAVNLKQSARLLDIGGGSGIYACALAAKNAHLRATVIEKPPVDQAAARWIDSRGFTDRIDDAVRDMLTQALPSGNDVHLYSNVLHDWDVPVVKQLIAKSRDALLPGGRLLIHDAHLNRDRTGPLEVAEYSVLLMHATEGRCYSVAEIESYLLEAGFKDVEHRPTAASRSVIWAVRK